MKSPILHGLRVLFLLLGAAFLWIVLQKIGLETLRGYLPQFRLLWIPLLLISSLWYLLYGLAWGQFIWKEGRSPSLLKLFRIKIVGEAANTLTPFNFVGGDPLRIYLLRNFLPMTQATATVVVDRTLQMMATLAVVLVGMVTAFVIIPGIPHFYRTWLPVVVGGISLFVFLFFLSQQRGFFATILGLIPTRLGRFRSQLDRKAQGLDEKILQCYREDRWAFTRALGLHLAGRLLGVLEVYLVGRWFQSDFGIITALELTALAPMVNLLFVFVPGALGIMEGAFSGVLFLLGFDPSLGIAIQMAKRLRATFWISMGFLFFGVQERRALFSSEAP